MLAVQTLRPLPAEGPLTQPALEQLREPGLHIVHAPPGYIMSENVAAVFGEDVAWLRLSRLDMHPACMAEALAVLVPDARSELCAAASPRELGTILTGHLTQGTTVVAENTNGRASSTTALEFVRGVVEAGAERAVVVSHSQLRKVSGDAAVLGKKELAANPTTSSPTIEKAVSLLGVPAIANVLSRSGGRAAVVQDTLTAILVRDGGAVQRAVTQSRRRRRFLRALSWEMLRTCSAAELEALTVAAELGYWSPSMGGNADGATLRPWLVPLDSGWFWLRPVWRSVLHRQLELAPVPRRAARGRGGTYPAANESSPPPTQKGRPEASEQQSLVEAQGLGQHQVAARLFGRLAVRVDGQEIEQWEGRLPPMILAFLLSQEHRSAQRDVLMNTFWPDIDPKRARNRMHVALSSLRRSIRTVSDVEILEYDQGRYGIANTIGVQLDVDEFTVAAQQGFAQESAREVEAALASYRRAADLYVGDFLADTPYEEWTILYREAHRSTYLEVLQRMAALLEAEGRRQECVAIGQLMLRQDPCSENAHRLLIRSYSGMGEHRRALRQFDLCRRTLDHVLGVPPSHETLEALHSAKAAYGN